MKVYVLSCPQLHHSCVYDNISEMLKDIQLAIEEDEIELDFKIEPQNISQKKYDELPEDGSGW